MSHPLLSNNNSTKLAAEFLKSGTSVRFQVQGTSMHPFLKDGDVVTVTPFDPTLLKKGALAFAQQPSGSFVLHRVTGCDGTRISLAGDAFVANDEEFPIEFVLGNVIKLERGHREVPLRKGVAMFWYHLRPARHLLRRLTRTRG